MDMDYKSAGVDVEAGYKSVELIKKFVLGTRRSEVISELGGFGGMFSIARAKNMEDPILVSGTDGVGTKLNIAFIANTHDTIGIDCVAMSVNDIICSGAEPLFFLDYIACGKNKPEKIAHIVKGVANGCTQSGCSLIGGETAEMPGFYDEDEYDIAGFAVGIVDRPNVIDGTKICAGDVLIGIASSGLHSNGFSLVRKVLEPDSKNISEFIPELNETLKDALLRPTKIYVKSVLELIKECEIKGIGHITGGGFYENIPRMYNNRFKAVIKKNAFETPSIFKYIQNIGNISEKVMYNTFNMGIGMVLCCPYDDAQAVVKKLTALGEKAYIIGNLENGEGLEIC